MVTGTKRIAEIDVDQPRPEARELGRHASYVTGLALAGTTLVSGGYDGRLMWWNIESRSKIREVDAHRKCDPSGHLCAEWCRRG